MRLTLTGKALVLACETIPAHDGYKERYQIAIMQGTETATLSCTKEVVDANPKPFAQYGLIFNIRDYKGDYLVNVSGIVPIDTGAAASAPASASAPAKK